METDGPVLVQFLDLHVDTSGAGESLVARLSAEHREPVDADPAPGPVRGHGEHVPALEGLHGRRVSRVEPEPKDASGVGCVHRVEHAESDTLTGGGSG